MAFKSRTEKPEYFGLIGFDVSTCFLEEKIGKKVLVDDISWYHSRSLSPLRHVRNYFVWFISYYPRKSIIKIYFRTRFSLRLCVIAKIKTYLSKQTRSHPLSMRTSLTKLKHSYKNASEYFFQYNILWQFVTHDGCIHIVGL